MTRRRTPWRPRLARDRAEEAAKAGAGPLQDSANTTQINHGAAFYGAGDRLITAVAFAGALLVALVAAYVALTARTDIAELRGVADRALERATLAEREARLAQERGDRLEVEVKVLRGVLEVLGVPVPAEAE